MFALDHNLEVHRSTGQFLETISWRGLPRLHSYAVLAARADRQAAPHDDEPVHDFANDFFGHRARTSALHSEADGSGWDVEQPLLAVERKKSGP